MHSFYIVYTHIHIHVIINIIRPTVQTSVNYSMNLYIFSLNILLIQLCSLFPSSMGEVTYYSLVWRPQFQHFFHLANTKHSGIEPSIPSKYSGNYLLLIKLSVLAFFTCVNALKFKAQLPADLWLGLQDQISSLASIIILMLMAATFPL